MGTNIKNVIKKYKLHCKSKWSVPRAIKKKVFNERGTYDLVTPLKKGKEWTFEFLLQYQPKTARLLMDGGDLYLFSWEYNDEHPLHMALEVNGIAVEIHRERWGKNPDDPDYPNMIERSRKHLAKVWGKPVEPSQRHLCLPEPLQKAWYTRLDGMSILQDAVFSIYDNLLPMSTGNWDSISDYLGGLRLKKKYLPLIEEMLPNIRTKLYPDRYDLKMFLDSRPSHLGKEGDVLFVNNNTKDQIIYYIKDGDVPNLMTLADPVEAIDCYCEHVLLRKEGRFDFMPWAVPYNG